MKQTKIDVERTPTGLRIKFSDAIEGDDASLVRHWDLPLVQALQLASSLTVEVATFLALLSKAKRLAVSKEPPAETAPPESAGNGKEHGDQGDHGASLHE